MFGIVVTKRVKQFLQMVGLAILSVIVALWLLIAIIRPGPEGKLVIAAGGASGAYAHLAESYKAELARFGVSLEVKSDMEGADTLQRVLAADSGVDAGIIKGGVAGSMQGRLANAADHIMRELQAQRLQSAGRLFYEPLWVFYRGPRQVKSLGEFKGRRIMVGSSTSGTRRVVTLLLKANGVTPENSTFIEQEFPSDGRPLTGDGADVAFVSLPPESKRVQDLLRVPNILLMDFSAEATAYTARFPFLSAVTLHRGSVEFEPDIPSADITLLTTTPALIVKRELHPSLAILLTHAAVANPKPGFDATGEPTLFYRAGQFPSANDPEYEVDPDAKAYYKTGDLPLILRSVGPFNARLGIPFWVTAFAHQHATKIILLAIPVLSILIPLLRFLPMLYTWTIRRRLLHWYDKLKELEHTLDHSPTPAQLAEVHQELEEIDRAVSRIKLPLAFSDQLYDLRGHIDLVQQRLTPRRVPVQAAAE